MTLETLETFAVCEKMQLVLPTSKRIVCNSPSTWNLPEWKTFIESLPPMDRELADKDRTSRVDGDAFNALCEGVGAVLEERINVRRGLSTEVVTKNFHGTAYAMKLGTCNRVVCVGDVHSSVHALMQTIASIRKREYLDDSLRLSAGTTLIFLGDVVNRGPYNLACLSLVLTIIERNPRAYCVAGNHEGIDMWREKSHVRDTLGDELKRVGVKKDPVARVLQLLPTVLFATIGGETVQFNHAGVDPVLAGANFKKLAGKPKGPTTYNILWGTGENVLKAYLKSRQSVLVLGPHNSTCNRSETKTQPATLERCTKKVQSSRDVFAATDDNLQKWGDLGGMGNEARLDEETGRWEFGREAISLYLKNAGVNRIVGGHQDLTQLGIFGKFASTKTDVFDLSQPVQKDGIIKISSKAYTALKTSIAWESKPGDFQANCFVVLCEVSNEQRRAMAIRAATKMF